MRFLITGANGQLAREFIRILNKEDIITLTKEELDISDLNAVEKCVGSLNPDVILNCAAYNLVDKSEDDIETAIRVNAHGVKNLAAASKRFNAFFVHYSTDYVFDGKKEDFYTEDDEPIPINNYGKSKLSGERYLQDETDNFLLFRVSWVFGKGRQNFLCKLLDLADKNKVIRIVSDQISVPTYVNDIAKTTLSALGKGLKGIYHLTNSGYASRYEVARYFLEKLGKKNLILPVRSDYFPCSAKRPYFSAMSNNKISKAVDAAIPDWEDGIDRYVEDYTKHGERVF
ncbi:MAG: dTDP-4-dehydrorhamnose reductase [Deltaproteobacteria bacterium]|nr:dTDP-4-dehydrorhamnose reductase [Deltaproteobacteria bacterium]